MRTAIVSFACAALLVAGAGPAAADDVTIGDCDDADYVITIETPFATVHGCGDDPLGPIET